VLPNLCGRDRTGKDGQARNLSIPIVMKSIRAAAKSDRNITHHRADRASADVFDHLPIENGPQSRGGQYESHLMRLAVVDRFACDFVGVVRAVVEFRAELAVGLHSQIPAVVVARPTDDSRVVRRGSSHPRERREGRRACKRDPDVAGGQRVLDARSAERVRPPPIRHDISLRRRAGPRQAVLLR